MAKTAKYSHDSMLYFIHETNANSKYTVFLSVSQDVSFSSCWLHERHVGFQNMFQSETIFL